MGKDKSAKKNDAKKVKQAAKLGKASSKKDLKSKGKSDKKKKKSSSSDDSDASGSSSEANPQLEEAKEQLFTVAMAFGLLLVCIVSPLPSTCIVPKIASGSHRCRCSRKQKDLNLNNQKCHLRDISAPQLATILVGIVPVLTPNAVMKLGGDVVQAAWLFRLIDYLIAEQNVLLD